MAQSSVTMKVLVIVMCVCAALSRPNDVKVEKKPTAAQSGILDSPIPTVVVKRATQVGNIQQDSSLPNVSEDVLEKALNDRRFVQRQIKCATGEGPCDPIGRKIKAHAPLVMKGMCVKCSPSEIKQIQRVMSHIQKNYPKEYTQMLKQYQSGF